MGNHQPEDHDPRAASDLTKSLESTTRRDSDDNPVAGPDQAGARVGQASAESASATTGTRVPAYLEQLRAEELQGRRAVGSVASVMAVLDRHKDRLGFIVYEPRRKKDFIHIDVTPCFFNAGHKRAAISIHDSRCVNYLCPHHSCKGLKERVARKAWSDVLALLGE